MKIVIFSIFFGMFNLIFADISLTYDMDYEKLKFKYKDNSNNKLYIISPDYKKALYTINDDSYLVTTSKNIAKVTKIVNKPKKPTIINATETGDPNYKIKKYKKQKLIAGIQGYKWMVYGRTDGQVYSQIIYVTNDKRVLKAVKQIIVQVLC